MCNVVIDLKSQEKEKSIIKNKLYLPQISDC